jgi:hypothetical protein
MKINVCYKLYINFIICVVSDPDVKWKDIVSGDIHLVFCHSVAWSKEIRQSYVQDDILLV